MGNVASKSGHRTFAEMMMSNTRIISVKRENAVKTIKKNSDGSMLVVQNSGEEFTITKDDSALQEFVVWTMIDDQLTDR
jgi:hypothetical protein